jgi:transposase
MNKTPPLPFSGVDISKATLHLDFKGQRCLANTPEGCQQLLQVVAIGQVQLICEATGGYEKNLLAACHAVGQPITLINSAQARYFARAQGQRAKNDPLDAAVLTAYGNALQPKPTLPTDPANTALRELVQWRDHLQEQLTRARQVLEHGVPPFVAKKQKQLVAHLEQQLKAVAKEQNCLLKRTPKLQCQVEALSQLDGVSTVTALSILSRMPELGTLNRQAAASLAGLAPWVRQSGPWEGQRHIGGGRALVRRTLYMPAVVLARMKHTPLGKFYAHLRAEGKPAKVALTAVMRKLLLQMNRVLKELISTNQIPQSA